MCSPLALMKGEVRAPLAPNARRYPSGSGWAETVLWARCKRPGLGAQVARICLAMGRAVSPHKSASPKNRLVGPPPLNSGKPGAMAQSRQAEEGISVLGPNARPIEHRFNQAIAALGLRCAVYFLLERAGANAPGANSLVLSTAITWIVPVLGP